MNSEQFEQLIDALHEIGSNLERIADSLDARYTNGGKTGTIGIADVVDIGFTEIAEAIKDVSR